MSTNSLGLEYSVIGLEAKYFGGIKKTSFFLEKRVKWIFLTGDNGYGKTSVLQALSIAILGFEENNYLKIKHFPVLVAFIKTINDITMTRASLPKKELKSIPIVGYGATRLNVSSYEGSKVSSPVESLFKGRAVLENIEFSLSRWFLKQEDEEFKQKYKSTTKIFKQLIPNLKEIKIDRKTDEVTYIEQDENGKAYPPVTLDQLAAGYRSIIAMIGDMILRLFKTQPDIYDPKNLAGIVIIDELDLHFHPNIQRKLPSLLSSIFPKVQFICSTHSPIPILGAPKDSAFLTVKRSQEKGITIEVIDYLEVSKLTPNTILTSPIFGFTDILSETLHGKSRARTEDTYNEIKFNDEVEKRLKKFAEENNDEFEGMF